jgi:molybdopterin-guanine dinucleotide biosynthesis protein A
MQHAAIVLCGGHSRRMGRDKAALPFGGDSLLSRVVGIVARVVDEVWIVAREGQTLPEIPSGCRVARDPREGLGPLAGLAAGLAAMKSERAFLTSCDVPLLQPAYLHRLFALSHGHPAAVPRVDGRYMVTSAIYARELLPMARQLLEQRRLRPLFLIQAVDTRVVEESELRDCDPELLSLFNCNTPDAYREAVRIAGLHSSEHTRPGRTVA